MSNLSTFTGNGTLVHCWGAEGKRKEEKGRREGGRREGKEEGGKEGRREGGREEEVKTEKNG